MSWGFSTLLRKIVFNSIDTYKSSYRKLHLIWHRKRIKKRQTKGHFLINSKKEIKFIKVCIVYFFQIRLEVNICWSTHTLFWVGANSFFGKCQGRCLIFEFYCIFMWRFQNFSKFQFFTEGGHQSPERGLSIIQRMTPNNFRTFISAFFFDFWGGV